MANDETQQSSASREPVGQRLKRARERQGLDINKVANTQHLRPAVIQAIENGDYREINSELFLKGYVRSYARQVSLDADELIADLDQELAPLREERAREYEAHPLVDIERRKLRKLRIARIVVVLAMLLLLVLGGLYFFDGRTAGPQQEPSAVTQPEDPPEAPTAGAAPEADELPAAAEADMEPVPAEPYNEQAAEPEQTGGGEEVAMEPSAPETQQAPESTDASPEPVPESASLSDPAPTAPNQAPVPAAATQEPEPALAGGPLEDLSTTEAQLQMSFSGDCWVQVTDSTGTQLVGSLKRDGDRLEVSGSTPLQVIIGAVDAVDSIRFAGEPVELSSYRVFNNRAEFTLDL